MSNFNIESVELRVKNMTIMKEYYSEKLKFHIISEEKDENNIKVTLGTKVDQSHLFRAWISPVCLEHIVPKIMI